MRSQWWAVATALMIMLSGCAEETDPEPVLDDAVSHDGGNQTLNVTVPNTAPTAGLTASVLNGTAPLNVTLEISGGDEDGDELTWTLVLGNETVADGTELPASVNQTLEAGNHTFQLVVSDGNATTNATLTVTVEPGVTGPCGGEPEPCVVGEDDYAIFWSDGRCDARPEQVYGAGGVYVHERAAIPGTALVLGGGTWVYEESNGVSGLQIDGAFEGGTYSFCLDGDLGIF